MVVEEPYSKLSSEAVIRAVISQRLVDEEWYRQANGLSEADSPLADFLSKGWRSGAGPNPFFDPGWYLSQNVDIPDSDDPLTHYLLFGESEGRWPCRLLDPTWYAAQHDLKLGDGAVLSHYLRYGAEQGLKPNPIFDPKFYLKANPDLPEDFRRAAIHYAHTGYLEARSIGEDFDGRWYRRTYLGDGQGDDPLHHYLTVGRARGYTRSPEELENSATELRRFAAPGPDFEEFDPHLVRGKQPRAKIIAFYLPQFHAIPENDEWWGTGFTEWRNVCRGQPRFTGHHQPRTPRDLGFYDLIKDPTVMPRQIELAKAAGIYGFCFYYYQFGKRKLLEKPIQRFLADPSLDFPFCLLWANENWTRRWDGQESEILLEQKYRPEDDEDLIRDVALAMRDPRYIRVSDRPLFIIYRPGAIPEMRERAVRWRRLFRERHNVEPWLLMAQVFQDHDPTVFGLDGAVEFPPHKLNQRTARITDRVKLLDLSFKGDVWNYEDIITNSLDQATPSYPLIRTAVPSWDNDARRQGCGDTFAYSTPAAYQRWLEGLIDWAHRHRFADEALVFVNAWNEWAEGAYLEPDVHFGSAYLNATARALAGRTANGGNEKPHILLVGHDAHEHGAQMTLLHLGRALVRRFGVKVTFLLLGTGRMLPRYQEIAPVVVANPQGPDYAAVLGQLQGQGLQYALTNTVVTGAVVDDLKRLGMRVISLVHELPRLIRDFGIEDSARAIAAKSDVVVFPAPLVSGAFEAAIRPVAGRQLLLPQGLYVEMSPVVDARVRVRSELEIAPAARIVLGIGYGDLRKGLDLFLETARAAASDPSLVFVWVGAVEHAMRVWILNPEIVPLPHNFRHVPYTTEINRYLHAADAFYLTSREDPFPTTVLEALACGLPVVGFAGCSGTQDLIERFGELVPAYETQRAVHALATQIERQSLTKVAARKTVVAQEFDWNDYAFRLLQELNPDWRRISVVVPNYNYGMYLEERLSSIFRQTVPIYELIVLDDGSADESVRIAARIANEQARNVRIIANNENSGSVIKQWLRGVQEASGELIWIAEADDSATPHLLARLAAAMNPQTLMAFCDSAQIDADGNALGGSYGFYYRIFHGSKFDTDFTCSGNIFAKSFLATSNIILNVSSMLFRRQALLQGLTENLEELASYRFAGDWLAYLSICRQPGEVSFCAQPLNIHRRHGDSATHRTTSAAHVAEIARVHEAFGRMFDATPDIRAAQRVYRNEVSEQFGLEPA
jgi:glycosyltransferase involved in cell wall biosynthesis